jgi:hypothetical protein
MQQLEWREARREGARRTAATPGLRRQSSTPCRGAEERAAGRCWTERIDGPADWPDATDGLRGRLQLPREAAARTSRRAASDADVD